MALWIFFFHENMSWEGSLEAARLMRSEETSLVFLLGISLTPDSVSFQNKAAV